MPETREVGPGTLVGTPSDPDERHMVYVIDDDAAARDSLAFLLDCHGFDSRTFESATQFIGQRAGLAPGAQRAGLPPACIVTDIRMPGMNGLELVIELRARDILDPVIVITGHADVALAVQAMHAGVSDFIEKPFDDQALLGAIRSALTKWRNAGEIDAERQRITGRLATLSGREREVMDGLLEGKANKVIAYDLGISARTVEVYRANVMSKTAARTLSELVRMVTIARLAG